MLLAPQARVAASKAPSAAGRPGRLVVQAARHALAPVRRRRLLAAAAPERGRAASAAGGCGGGGAPLDIDDTLLTAVRPLIGAVCREMESHMESCKEAGSAHVAASALAAAEANGAVPPLSGRQRDALLGALERAAAAFRSGDEEDLLPERGSSTAREGDAGDLDEGALFSITPLAKELYETLVNQRTHAVTGERTASPADSVKAGGEVGNISLQSATGRTSPAMPHGVPAEGLSERAEHEAECQFMEIELGDPESGRVNMPPPPEGAAERAKRAQQAPHDLEHSLVMDASDAPVAGDGMQVLGDADQEVLRPIREHYERREEATEGS